MAQFTRRTNLAPDAKSMVYLVEIGEKNLALLEKRSAADFVKLTSKLLLASFPLVLVETSDMLLNPRRGYVCGTRTRKKLLPNLNCPVRERHVDGHNTTGWSPPLSLENRSLTKRIKSKPKTTKLQSCRRVPLSNRLF
jgi:hypothetical protein